MDWTEVAALGSIGAACAALTAALIAWRVGRDQVRSAIQANGVNLAIQLRAHVNTAEFRAARHKAAGDLLAGTYSSYVVYVLDELETLGLLVRRGVLDAEIIWTMVSALVANYVAAARPFIRADRERNPTLWANLLDLEGRMISVERRQQGPAQRVRLDRGAAGRRERRAPQRRAPGRREHARVEHAGGGAVDGGQRLPELARPGRRVARGQQAPAPEARHHQPRGAEDPAVRIGEHRPRGRHAEPLQGDQRAPLRVHRARPLRQSARGEAAHHQPPPVACGRDQLDGVHDTVQPPA